MKDKKADIGIIGMGVMGQNLALNLSDNGYTVVVFNRTEEKTEKFLRNEAVGKDIIGAKNLEGFFSILKKPKKILIMVKAGEVVDEWILHCLAYLKAGDILMDGGNSHFMDTEKREHALNKKKIFYLGIGISGGEEGARRGSSLMIGGKKAAFNSVEKMFSTIAAKAKDNVPCCSWISEGGSGHFVKMVHNGIEYAEMQLIAEVFDILRQNSSYDEIAQIFSDWNSSYLESYLLEISVKILKKQEEDGSYLIDHILDTAQQKGTGKWTVICALERDIALNVNAEAVFARYISSRKEERCEVSKIYPKKRVKTDIKKTSLKSNDKIKEALFVAKIIIYTQAFALMKKVSLEKGWKLNYRNIALTWREGCIIRCSFLDMIAKAFAKKEDLPLLIIDEEIKEKIISSEKSLRETVQYGAGLKVSMFCMGSSLFYFDAIRSARLPTNLIQAQRDFFGSHMYEREDHPRGEWFHTKW